MTKIPSVEETAKAIIENVRHCATPHQHPDNSVEAKAYLEGVNTAMAMLYIDFTGTPKVKGFLNSMMASSFVIFKGCLTLVGWSYFP